MGIKKYQNLLDRFVQKNMDLLGDNLIGIYLHGSAVTGCFNAEKSDIDLLTVVENDLSYETKKMYMDMTIEFNKEAPPKGMELSIVKEEFLKPFAYPTPYELHFSLMHLDWYRSNPNEYIEKMKGTDKDLAAHVTVIYHRGKTLYGKEIKEVFSPVGKKEYFDSLWHDIHNAKTDILNNPTYIILNLCRVLAYVKVCLVLSKKEGGEWGLMNVPEKYRTLITAALEEYQNDAKVSTDEEQAEEFAEYMLSEIEKDKEKISGK
jgi:predicted nucleotidyltransferase